MAYMMREREIESMRESTRQSPQPGADLFRDRETWAPQAPNFSKKN
jgi:hypothetical protein